MSVTPLVLRGNGFAAGERVEVTLVRAGRTSDSRAAQASGAGVFSVRFPLLAVVQPCRSLVVRATGSQGSHAVYVLRCEPADPALP